MTRHSRTKIICRSGRVARLHPTESKILVVDDYDANILVISTHLECLGLSYDVASNGVDAIQLVTGHQYAVILMDIQMPGMDGIETTSLIRDLEQSSGWQRHPIIAFTAHPEFMQEDKWRSLGMDNFIPKPFQSFHLKNVLAKYVGINNTL